MLKLIISIVFNILLEFIYQYVGNIWAIESTKDGKNSTGTNAPHKKDDPNATTFTIPVTESLLLIMVLINNASVKQQNEKINKFNM